MKSSTRFGGSLNAPIESLIRAMDSLIDGDMAVDLLIACGKQAIGPVGEFLLDGKPRTIALPRRRAARVLGHLDARSVLLAYFEKVELPRDAAVLFAEDAVRSDVARELMRWRDEETFQTLLRATRRRATFGLIEALGEFRRPETIPLLFESLEDDLCRAAAFPALLKTPGETHQYAVLCLRGEVRTTLEGTQSARRRRGVLELLRKLKSESFEWREVSRFLQDRDPAVVICTASLGFRVAHKDELPEIVRALFRVAAKLNWLQEDEMIHLLDEHQQLARSVGKQILADLRARGEHTNWLSPTWRILGHLVPIDNPRSGR